MGRCFDLHNLTEPKSRPKRSGGQGAKLRLTGSLLLAALKVVPRISRTYPKVVCLEASKTESVNLGDLFPG